VIVIGTAYALRSGSTSILKNRNEANVARIKRAKSSESTGLRAGRSHESDYAGPPRPEEGP
jgi:hypothetical protein